MIHLTPLMDRHSHSTVVEARQCDAELQQDYAEVMSEIHAENAWLRAAEYDPRLAEETAREAALEDMMRDGLLPV